MVAAAHGATVRVGYGAVFATPAVPSTTTDRLGPTAGRPPDRVARPGTPRA
jgi:hypothetical protein